MNIPVTIDIKAISFPTSDQLESSIHGLTATASEPQTRDSLLSTERQEFVKALIQVAGQTWRMGTIIFEPDSGEPKTDFSSQDIRKLSNAVEAIKEVVKALDVRVLDRCNEDFHPGLPDTVVTEEPQEGITKERIIRTIRPTIMWGQTMVQRGEIDVAVPVTKKEEN